MDKLDAKIEAFLFFKNEPISIKKLALFFEVSEEEIGEALNLLNSKLKEDRGLQLIFKEDNVLLGTRNEYGPIIEKIMKEEINKELSKASLETLAVIIYQNGVTRADIDYIRGVNCSFILRNLMIRGLIEKIIHPEDQRKFLYKPTLELMSYLGISKLEELPEYENICNTLNNELIK